MNRRLAQARSLPAAASAARSRPGLLSTAMALVKIRIGIAIMLSSLSGAVLAAGGWPAAGDILIMGLAVLIAASGAGAFNHWYDRDIDALMGRTRKRPFVNGTLKPHIGWPVLCMALIVCGALLAGLHFNIASGLLIAAGALTYALVYTVWLKRRTDWNIVIGGAAGSWAVLAGAAAFGSVHDPAVLLLAAVLFLWTPSHFWSLSVAVADDYARAGVPMLPVTRGLKTAVRWNAINTVLLVITSLTLGIYIGSYAAIIGSLVGSAWLVITTHAMVRDSSRTRAMRAFTASLIQLGLLLAGLFASYAVP